MTKCTVSLLSFPAGKHDDQVDALGLIGQLLAQMIGGSRPSAAAAPRIFKKPNDYVAPEPVGRNRRLGHVVLRAPGSTPQLIWQLPV
jgi:hypothetical protein